jgi:hypothetical protein
LFRVPPFRRVRQDAALARDLQRIVVPGESLDHVISKHQLTKLDLLLIDAEGHDYNVLRTLDLSKCQPQIVRFEHGHLLPWEIDAAVHYLGDNGYRVLYGGYQHDTIALHETFPMLPAS